MSHIDTEAQENQTASQITVDAVMEFLQKHPDFMQKNPKAWETQELAHDCGDATSLLEMQLKQLRKRCAAYSNNHIELIKNARDNDIQFEKTKLLVAELAGSNNLFEMMDALESNFSNQFKASSVRLVMFGMEAGHPLITSVASQDRDYDDWLEFAATSWASCVQVEVSLLRDLLSNEQEKMRSAAILPIHANDKPVGLVVVASTSSDHYSNQLDTLFLNHVATVCGCVIGRFSD